MNILFLPNNIASLPSITANALNKVDGINARNIVDGMHKSQSADKSTLLLPETRFSRLRPYKRFKARKQYKKELKKWIEWADVLHYVFGPALKNARDLKWAMKENKKIFVEWVGSDLRDPAVLKKINSFYANIFDKGYEYRKFEESNYKMKVQSLFSKVGASVIVSPEMRLFLNQSLFPNYHIIYQRLNLCDFKPHFPSINNHRPLIVHSPTAKVAKGSSIIKQVIDELKKEYDFEFILLHSISRHEVLEITKKADIFLDQIICGGYGMACSEAMAFGKPVMCYIMKEVYEAGLPEDFPVVNTNPDNLKQQLIKLISNPQLRHDIGLKSREYAEKYFDANKIACQLIDIYKGEVEKGSQNA